MRKRFALSSAALLCFFSSAAHAVKPSCGLYHLQGRLTLPAGADRPAFLMNEGTRSETRLEIRDEAVFRKIASHLNQRVELDAVVKKSPGSTAGEILDLHRIELRAPNPVTDIGMRYVKEASCAKP